MKVIINEKEFIAVLYDTKAAISFYEKLPLSLDMKELNRNEKYYYLPFTLSESSFNPQYINSGDIYLYQNNCLVLFYESFSTSYSYTKIGKLKNVDGLSSALGSGNVKVEFTK